MVELKCDTHCRDPLWCIQRKLCKTWQTELSLSKNIEVGDRVAYSAKWLRSTGQHTGAVPFMRGQVTEISGSKDFRLATVSWDCGTVGSVITPNLTKESRIAQDAVLADQRAS